MANNRPIRDKPRIYFVRGGVYIKTNELLESKVGQLQMERAGKLREFLQARDRKKMAEVKNEMS